MKVNVTIGQQNEIHSLVIVPETKEDLQNLQKVKRDYDKHIEIKVIDQSNMADYLRIKVTLELLPTYT